MVTEKSTGTESLNCDIQKHFFDFVSSPLKYTRKAGGVWSCSISLPSLESDKALVKEFLVRQVSLTGPILKGSLFPLAV